MEIELEDMVEKHSNLITINYGTYYLYFGILHSKSVILLGLCLVLANGLFSSIFISVFKITYPVKMEYDFSYSFSGYVCVT